MNKTLKEIKSVRLDLSDYLFHFTKGEQAMADLINIISQRKIKDIHKTGVICFTEAPLYALVDMFNIFNRYKKPKYTPYGIGVKKSHIYKLGGRPVIYGPKEELRLFRKKVKWRYENYSSNNDFTWLREWRLPTKEKNKFKHLKITPKDNFIITKTYTEELMIAHSEGEIVVDVDISDGESHPFYNMIMKREWKSISIERISEKKISSNEKIKKQIGNQKIGEENFIYLGIG